MHIGEARMIREIKKGCDYRELARIYWPENHRYHAIPMWGENLVHTACRLLGISLSKPPPLNKDTKSRLGEFYWWL
jgi:hypothetical protein